MIVDETFHPGGPGCYELVRVHHTDGHVLRIRVRRDSYQQQSHAVLEILTLQYIWTPLADTPASDWHHHTPASPDAAPLTPIADRLLDRARRILAVPPNTGRAAAPPDGLRGWRP